MKPAPHGDKPNGAYGVVHRPGFGAGGRKTASMPKIFGSQLIAGTEVVKDRSQSHPKILDRSGAVDDNVGVQEQGTMQAIQNITDGCGGAAGLKPGDLSPEQSGLHGGSLAVLRDRRVQRVAQLGSASPLGGEGRDVLSRDSGPGAGSHVAPGLSVGVGHDCPAHIDDQLAATASEVAGALRRTRKGTSRMMALLALAASVAASAHVVDVTRGYANGKDCAAGSGCLTKPTVTDCLLCCGMWCNHSGFLGDCQNACIGGSPSRSNSTVQQIAVIADEIRSNKLSGDDLAVAVSVIETAMRTDDVRVATFARIVGGETPMVNVQ